MAHDHTHADASTNRTRLGVALAITTTILLAELAGAALTDSLALLVDSAHMLTDALGLAVALAAASLLVHPPSPRRTWGWRRAEVIAAGVQAAVLLAVAHH